MSIDFTKLKDDSIGKLVEARWSSSSELWDIVEKTYKQNTAIYENKADWLDLIPERRRKYRIQANRVFVNMEAVINSLIANPPGLNILPSREGTLAQDFARKLESYFRKKYSDRNLKEIVRMGLRNLYFGRLLVIKAFWNPQLGNGGDFDFRSIDPRKVRIGKYARKEQDSEFVIEEIDDNLCAVVQRFPAKKKELMTKYGFSYDEKDPQSMADAEEQMYVKNPDVTYKEAWIQDRVIFKLENIILGVIKNPYWDWEGILVTSDEQAQLDGNESQGVPGLEGQARRDALTKIKLDQESRKALVASAVANTDPNAAAASAADPSALPNGPVPEQPETPQGEKAEEVDYVEPTQGATTTETPINPTDLKPYFFNYFDNPRKPYIFATIFNNENTPIGRTDMITLSSELQRSIDKRKMDIDENAELVNGMLKVDSSVMPKNDAQRIRFETKGIIWGKGVAAGVTREMGNPLPEFVHQDMLDSRSEIDNIMAASSAFRGEREGQETKAGRLALIQQSYLRLNELVQVVDFVSQEIFSWGMQLAKTRYTEYHYAKWMGKEGAREVIELIQDDFENGSEVVITSGKTLPVDNEFKFEQAQNDVEKGYISPVDYLEIAQYDNAKELAQNAVKYKINPIVASGIAPEEAAKLAPPQQDEKKPPNVTISYKDLPPDAQVQLLAQIGIQADPQIIVAEKMAEQKQTTEQNKAKTAALQSKATPAPAKSAK